MTTPTKVRGRLLRSSVPPLPPTLQVSPAAARAEHRRRRVAAALTVVAAVAVAAWVVLAVVPSRTAKFSKLPAAMSTFVKGYSAKEAQARRDGDSPQTQTVAFHVTGPVVVVSPATRTLETSVMLDLPAALQATDPSKVGLVVWIDRYDAAVGSYSGGGTAYRSTASLWFVVRGSVVDEEDAEGPSPPDSITCVNGTGCDGYGSALTDQDIAKFVEQWMASTPS